MLDADGKPLPAWKVRMRQRQRFWSTSYGFKVQAPLSAECIVHGTAVHQEYGPSP
jgi:hypothetical protein